MKSNQTRNQFFNFFKNVIAHQMLFSNLLKTKAFSYRRPDPFFIAAIFLMIGCCCNGQAKDAFIEFRGSSVSCFNIEIPATGEVVKKMLEEKLTSENLKSKPDKEGFSGIARLKHPQISSGYVDVYYKIAELNVSSIKRSACVNFLVSKGYENFINTQADSVISGNVKILLNSLFENVLRDNCRAEITNQSKIVDKETQTLSGIQSAIDKMEIEKESLVQKISKAKTDLDGQLLIKEEAGQKLIKLRLELEKLAVAQKPVMDPEKTDKMSLLK